MYEELYQRPTIYLALDGMLKTLADSLERGELPAEDYMRILDCLRLKLGEALYERYRLREPLPKARATV